MRANYHTHTWRCMHASGTEREYVESAIRGGIEILGFSDHTPYPYPREFTSHMRMGVEQLEGYVDTISALKEEYREDIEIHIGLEVEYYTEHYIEYFHRLQRLVADYPIEYFLLGQHYIECEIGGSWSGRPTDDPRTLQQYCAQTVEAMETGYFTYVAHPDLIRFTGEEGVYEEQMRALCRKARHLRLPLEINCLGIHEGRHYPDERFWRIAGEEGCEAILGIDAHNPESLNCPRLVQEAEGIAKRYGLALRETVEFRAVV